MPLTIRPFFFRNCRVVTGLTVCSLANIAPIKILPGEMCSTHQYVCNHCSLVSLQLHTADKNKLNVDGIKLVKSNKQRHYGTKESPYHTSSDVNYKSTTNVFEVCIFILFDLFNNVIT